MELKVALCQFDMVWEDTAANLRTAGRMVAEADADLVILPEMFATGFVTDPGRVAQPMSGEIVQEMTRWVRTTGKAVAGSLIVEEEGRYYNRLLFIKPSGERVQSDKRHLFSIGGEGANFCPGRERGVVEYAAFVSCFRFATTCAFPYGAAAGTITTPLFTSLRGLRAAVTCGGRCSGPGRSRTRPTYWG